ncbi:hypothetical protein LWI28_001218 [Acer negundo]|uniref:Uncharacterized protein n=1 Tax=Acer negundo TaxID=4023 RepID=A0AAD5I582_ACENE|nr:hypothetical protein LWI28_001218 [Acer negundo]
MDTLPSQDFKNANEYLDEILALFEEKCEEGGQVRDTCDKQSSLEIIDLKSENANLLKEVEALRKERDEANKRAKDLARLVEEQNEDFARKTRKLQWQVELQDKTIGAIKEGLNWKENALNVANVKECDCLVELKGAERTIEMLTKKASKKEETLKVNTIKGNSNHPNARVNKTKVFIKGKTFQVQMEVDPQAVSYSWLSSVLGREEGLPHSSPSSSPETCKFFLPMEVGTQGKMD